MFRDNQCYTNWLQKMPVKIYSAFLLADGQNADERSHSVCPFWKPVLLENLGVFTWETSLQHASSKPGWLHDFVTTSCDTSNSSNVPNGIPSLLQETRKMPVKQSSRVHRLKFFLCTEWSTQWVLLLTQEIWWKTKTNGDFPPKLSNNANFSVLAVDLQCTYFPAL